MTKQPPSYQWLALQMVPVIRGRLLVISIPKRIIPLSTRRSRLKRLIREALRLKAYGLPRGSALKIFICGAAPKNVDLAAMTRMLDALLPSIVRRSDT